jgi:hypothetical protein
MSIFTNKMPNLTENTKVLILSKLGEGWSIRRLAQYYNIANSNIMSALKYQRHFTSMLSNLPNLYKKYDVQISKKHLYKWKKLDYSIILKLTLHEKNEKKEKFFRLTFSNRGGLNVKKFGIVACK